MGNELEHVQQRDAGANGEIAQQTAPGRSTLAADQAASSGVMPRVHAAAQANDLVRLAAIQHEMRDAMVATDPLHPPQEARDALATMRHWAMDRVADVRDRHAPRLAAAAATPASTAANTDATEAIEVTMDRESTPYLDFLMQGDPQYRYEHFNQTVADKVFAAVQLHGARRGVDQIGNRAAAEAESRQHGGLGATDDWCGAFAFTQAEQGGGMDPHWRVHMQGEGGIRSALAYAGMANVWIWAFDHWEQLAAYHAQRGSSRFYQTIDRTPPPQGIRAGDIVLIDNSFGTNPDHITTAISFDGRWLTTVGGNQARASAASAATAPSTSRRTPHRTTSAASSMASASARSTSTPARSTSVSTAPAAGRASTSSATSIARAPRAPPRRRARRSCAPSADSW